MSRNTHGERNTHHKRDDHPRIAEFIDAYSTGELEQAEKDEVEQHLASCQSCQLLLADIKQLRHLLHQYGENDPLRSSSEASLPSMANAVLSQITQRSSMQQSHLERPQKQSFQRRFQRNKWALSAVALLIVALFIGAFAWLFPSPSQQPKSVPPPIIWEVQHEQVVAQSNGTLFEIKYIVISPQEMRFFYAARSPHRGSIAVEATSLSSKGSPTPLVASTQPLGQLGAWDVGVIHVKKFLLSGQTIELRITPSGETKPMWILAPLKQPLPEPHPDSRTGLSTRNPLSGGEVLWIGPAGKEWVAMFQLNETQSKPDSIFIQMDNASSVRVITESEYRRILEENMP